MTTAAQHDRLKNGKQWICSTGNAGQPEREWSQSMAHQIAPQTGIQLPGNCVDPSFGTAF